MSLYDERYRAAAADKTAAGRSDIVFYAKGLQVTGFLYTTVCKRTAGGGFFVVSGRHGFYI